MFFKKSFLFVLGLASILVSFLALLKILDWLDATPEPDHRIGLLAVTAAGMLLAFGVWVLDLTRRVRKDYEKNHRPKLVKKTVEGIKEREIGKLPEK